MHRHEHRRPLLAAMLLILFTVNQAECALTALESTIVLLFTLCFCLRKAYLLARTQVSLSFPD
jgi:hypothetical protein